MERRNIVDADDLSVAKEFMERRLKMSQDVGRCSNVVAVVRYVAILGDTLQRLDEQHRFPRNWVIHCF